MSLSLQLCGRVWNISEGDKPEAEIHLDYTERVDEVVLHADASTETQLHVLRLAASHAQQFVKNRSVPAFGGLMIAKHRNSLPTSEDSRRLMNFGIIPEAISKLDRETIVKELRSLQIDVVVTVHKTINEAINAVLFQVGIKELEHNLISQRMIFDNELVVQFTIRNPNRFTFWNSADLPTSGGWNLHIVPSYHPVMNGWKSVGMVNGATNAYIHGSAVKSIYCPEIAKTNREEHSIFGSSWDHVDHPFRAMGHSMAVRLNTTKLRSAEGVEELTQLLHAVLGLNKEYVEISGGFRAPMKCPHNRLLEIHRPSPWPQASSRRNGNVARGSESHCVWAYRTLEKEGVLSEAHVPSWFIQEGWLKIYEGAEVQPGLY